MVRMSHHMSSTNTILDRSEEHEMQQGVDKSAVVVASIQNPKMLNTATNV